MGCLVWLDKQGHVYTMEGEGTCEVYKTGSGSTWCLPLCFSMLFTDRKRKYMAFTIMFIMLFTDRKRKYMAFTIMFSMLFTDRKRKYMMFTIVFNILFTAQTTIIALHCLCVSLGPCNLSVLNIQSGIECRGENSDSKSHDSTSKYNNGDKNYLFCAALGSIYIER